jgi:hypothetical protein
MLVPLGFGAGSIIVGVVPALPAGVGGLTHEMSR